MTEDIRANNSRPLAPLENRVGNMPAPTSALVNPNARYLKFIDNTKKFVAVAFGVCGVGFVICANRDDYLSKTLRRDSGAWGWDVPIFALGTYACLIAVLALIVEYLARPTASKLWTFRSFFVRWVFIVCASIAILIWMQAAYGLAQAIGAVVSAWLVLAAAREQHLKRTLLAVLAIVVIALTFWGSRSSYQYARRHVDEIVAAGSALAEQLPQHVGEIPIDDERVPDVIRKLGARRIWVDQERVAVYVGGDTEYQIYMQPHPTTTSNPVWAFRGKGSTKIADRLWSSDY